MMKTAEEIMNKYLAHELEKSYSDVNTCRDLIESAMEEYADAVIAERMLTAEGAEDLKQYMTNLLYSAYDKGAKQIEPPESERIELDKWVEEMINGIDEYFKSEQPTAEGAEEILKRYCNCTDAINVPLIVKIMQEFATLHAQKIADKMVSERLREENAYNDTLLAFIDEIQYMQKLYADNRFTQAEKKRDELAEGLDDIMRDAR